MPSRAQIRLRRVKDGGRGSRGVGQGEGKRERGTERARAFGKEREEARRLERFMRDLPPCLKRIFPGCLVYRIRARCTCVRARVGVSESIRELSRWIPIRSHPHALISCERSKPSPLGAMTSLAKVAEPALILPREKSANAHLVDGELTRRVTRLPRLRGPTVAPFRFA